MRTLLLFFAAFFLSCIPAIAGDPSSPSEASFCRHFLLENEAFLDALPTRFRALVENPRSARFFVTETSPLVELHRALDRILEAEVLAGTRRIEMEVDRLRFTLDVGYQPSKKTVEIYVVDIFSGDTPLKASAASGIPFLRFMTSITQWAAHQYASGKVTRFKFRGEDLRHSGLSETLRSLGFQSRDNPFCYIYAAASGVVGSAIGGLVGKMASQAQGHQEMSNVEILSWGSTSGLASAVYFYFKVCPGNVGKNLTLMIDLPAKDAPRS